MGTFLIFMAVYSMSIVKIISTSKHYFLGVDMWNLVLILLKANFFLCLKKAPKRAESWLRSELSTQISDKHTHLWTLVFWLPRLFCSFFKTNTTLPEALLKWESLRIIN